MRSNEWAITRRLRVCVPLVFNQEIRSVRAEDRISVTAGLCRQQRTRFRSIMYGDDDACGLQKQQHFST